MKKYIIALLVALGIVLMPSVKAVSLPKKSNHEIVKIYLFYSSGCPHCHDFINYFSSKYVDYLDYFEIVTYQVDSSMDNSNLMVEVGTAFGDDEDDLAGVPLIVIGSEFHQRGFGSDGTAIIEKALEEYENENYKDLVAELKEKTDNNAAGKTFMDACNVIGTKCKDPDAKEPFLSDGVVVGIIFGILVLGFGGLVLYSRK